jgi:1,4-alpha-glucan branching enzyme
VDETSDDTHITFNWDETGNVTSLTFRGWGENMKVMKLVLPQPSVVGSTTFRLSGHPNARVVAVAGTFNNWNQSQFLFARIDGEWVCRIVLPPGKYEYKFIVDGNWLLDPRNSKVTHDERGIENSVLIVD